MHRPEGLLSSRREPPRGLAAAGRLLAGAALLLAGSVAAHGQATVNECTLIQDPAQLRTCITGFGSWTGAAPAASQALPEPKDDKASPTSAPPTGAGDDWLKGQEPEPARPGTVIDLSGG